MDEAIGLIAPPPPPAPEKIPDSAVQTVARQFTAELKESHLQTLAAKDETILTLRGDLTDLRTQANIYSRWQKFFVAENVLFAATLLLHLFKH